MFITMLGLPATTIQGALDACIANQDPIVGEKLVEYMIHVGHVAQNGQMDHLMELFARRGLYEIIEKVC